MDRALILNASDDFKDMTPRDIQMSRLKLMQATNEDVKSGKAKYGDWYDTTAQKVVCHIDGTAQVIPLMWWKDWIEFNPNHMDKSKKIISRSADPASALARAAEGFERIVNSRGKTVMRVTEVLNYVVLCPEYTQNWDEMFLMSFMKTGHKSGMKWLNALRKCRIDLKNDAGEVLERAQAPIWAYAWNIKSSAAQNPEGDSYLIPECADGVLNDSSVWADLSEKAERLKAARQLVADRASAMSDGDDDKPTTGVDAAEAEKHF
ncbi:MAG: hypothetical protein H0X04_00215 [Chthoniobacterales bacterium]|nr:hypothetical protein [Chthoniobacterales bacterium]